MSHACVHVCTQLCNYVSDWATLHGRHSVTRTHTQQNSPRLLTLAAGSLLLIYRCHTSLPSVSIFSETLTHSFSFFHFHPTSWSSPFYSLFPFLPLNASLLIPLFSIQLFCFCSHLSQVDVKDLKLFQAHNIIITNLLKFHVTEQLLFLSLIAKIIHLPDRYGKLSGPCPGVF